MARDLEAFLIMKKLSAPQKAVRIVGSILAIAAAALATACAPREPSTEAERLARGKAIIERMSSKLASAQTLSVTTREVRDELKLNAQPHIVTLTRETVIRRPNRAYFKTSGDVQNEGWYDGVGFTIAMHGEKVFAQARMPETLDKTLDSMHERYGVATPVADLLYRLQPRHFSPTRRPVAGWPGKPSTASWPIISGSRTRASAGKSGLRPTVIRCRSRATPSSPRASACAKSIWRSATGTWPRRSATNASTPAVPADYEGIAILQRARVLRQHSGDAPAPAAAPAKK